MTVQPPAVPRAGHTQEGSCEPFPSSCLACTCWICASSPKTHRLSAEEGRASPYLYDAAVFHHVAMHFLVLCLVLFLLHLGCMLNAKRRKAECRSTLLTPQEQAPRGATCTLSYGKEKTGWDAASASLCPPDNTGQSYNMVLSI